MVQFVNDIAKNWSERLWVSKPLLCNKKIVNIITIIILWNRNLFLYQTWPNLYLSYDRFDISNHKPVMGWVEYDVGWVWVDAGLDLACLVPNSIYCHPYYGSVRASNLEKKKLLTNSPLIEVAHGGSLLNRSIAKKTISRDLYLEFSHPNGKF